MQDGGTGTGTRHQGRREPRGEPHFVLSPNLFVGPPGRGTSQFQIFIRTPSPEMWSETISGSEEVLAEKWGGLFLGYLLGKNYRRRDRAYLVGSLPCRGVLSFRSDAREVSGSETARLHHAARWRGGCVAVRGARAGASVLAHLLCFVASSIVRRMPLGRTQQPAADLFWAASVGAGER